MGGQTRKSPSARITSSPDYPNHLSDVPCPLPGRIERVQMSIASPLAQPSPNGRRVGIRIVTFEACSGFTHVTARRIAQPPKATFVTRLQPCQLPSRAARQLPDQSTTIRVESSSTDVPRLWGAPPLTDSCTAAMGNWPVFTLNAALRCRARCGLPLRSVNYQHPDRQRLEPVPASHLERLPGPVSGPFHA